MKTYRSAREGLGAVEQVLAAKPRLASRGRLPLREIRGAQFQESPLVRVASAPGSPARAGVARVGAEGQRQERLSAGEKARS